MRVRTSIAALTALTLSQGGCLDRPEPAELLAEPVIVTKRDPNAVFSSFSTFAMTDTIPLVFANDAGAGDAAPPAVAPAIANPTLDEISAQLVTRGYLRVDRTSRPDLGVAVTAVSRLNAVAPVYGAWWGSGPASGGYWGYPGAIGTTIGYTSVIVWQSGTLVVELYDLRGARAAMTQAIPISVVWTALVHGVLGKGGATLDSPPIAAIRQAFTQSPYVVRPTAPFMPLEVP